MIFINYRRKDSAPYAGRVYDRLAGHFGHGHVFMDIDQIEPGEVFDQVIQEKLAAVQVAVVLIGEHWLDIADANGQRRLDHSDDWVRLEIAAVLERGIRVIPVLVGGAAMPKSTQLPECLVPLTRRQAVEITSHARFHADADKLIKALEKIVGVPVPSKSEPPKKPEEPEKPGFPRFAAIAGVIGIGFVGIYFGLTPPKSTPNKLEPENQVIEPIVATKSSEAAVIEPEMVRIEPGKFLMGSPTSHSDGHDSERPQREVTINYAFEIGKYEVTFDEYDAFANATERQLPSDEGWGRGKQPVINVSFNDAQDYVNWLSKQTGKKYRLPSEAEWEYAARAGTKSRYWWGDEIGHNNANCDGCRSYWDDKQTAPVSSFGANAFGLYNTAGNVGEWVEDCWHDNYRNAPTNGSAWKKSDNGYCGKRVIRGGSWDKTPKDLRSTYRYGHSTEYEIEIYSGTIDGEPIYNYETIESRENYLGFRIARDF